LTPHLSLSQINYFEYSILFTLKHHFLVIQTGVWSQKTTFLHRIYFSFGKLPTIFKG
jgi:hypothetical protein